MQTIRQKRNGRDKLSLALGILKTYRYSGARFCRASIKKKLNSKTIHTFEDLEYVNLRLELLPIAKKTTKTVTFFKDEAELCGCSCEDSSDTVCAKIIFEVEGLNPNPVVKVHTALPLQRLVERSLKKSLLQEYYTVPTKKFGFYNTRYNSTPGLGTSPAFNFRLTDSYQSALLQLIKDSKVGLSYNYCFGFICQLNDLPEFRDKALKRLQLIEEGLQVEFPGVKINRHPQIKFVTISVELLKLFYLINPDFVTWVYDYLKANFDVPIWGLKRLKEISQGKLRANRLEKPYLVFQRYRSEPYECEGLGRIPQLKNLKETYAVAMIR